MSLTAFIFDIGNVLINFDQPRFQQRVAEDCGHSFEEIAANWQNETLLAAETGKVSCTVYFDEFKTRYGLEWSEEQWIKEYAAIYSVNEAGQSLFRDLKAAGHPVHLLSNLAEYNKKAIDLRYPSFFEQADRVFFSYELGLHKPDSEIYRKVCASLELLPEQCVFFDDADANVNAARELGMTDIHFHENKIEAIRKKLIACGARLDTR